MREHIVRRRRQTQTLARPRYVSRMHDKKPGDRCDGGEVVTYFRLSRHLPRNLAAHNSTPPQQAARGDQIREGRMFSFSTFCLSLSSGGGKGNREQLIGFQERGEKGEKRESEDGRGRLGPLEMSGAKNSHFSQSTPNDQGVKELSAVACGSANKSCSWLHKSGLHNTRSRVLISPLISKRLPSPDPNLQSGDGLKNN